MTETVAVKPDLLRWAVDRSRLAPEDLAQAFPKLQQWESGERQPTFRQLEDFARKTLTPLGYLFLEQPPVETLPIPDFRTVGDSPIARPSPNLIETIQVMQRRQAWMRESVIEDGQPALPFVGSAKRSRNVVALAKTIREQLGLSEDWAEQLSTWEEALRRLRQAAENLGILISISGVVGLNNHRPLDPQEFRGFVLCDDYAPLIFVNGKDSRSAQMFTLTHELIHLWLGSGGLFNLVNLLPHDSPTERFCNQVASEFLVIGRKLTERWPTVKSQENPFASLARVFKVSPVVVARRALDLELISRKQFFTFYERDQAEWRRRQEQDKAKGKSGGNFYQTQDSRLGPRFAYAVVRAAREGRLLYRDAYQLTDLKGETFEKYADQLTQRVLQHARP
ncbi:ImmA/IrrE family metallo-endopeptidase [Planctellipticum variicoloris]|uniref:ImmA/IrrE family metallo-endopeptidase n=1 Tax=Planctellipticum variicoloris TaxID=3064265 RepID=UPI003013C7F8|nr:ImmA/IrrE family metallo-endopeptidase [Planctomycetaceae bacterium SH412]